MTDEEMKELLKTMCGESDDGILSAYLKMAADKITMRCYPFQTREIGVPEKYRSLQLEIACYLLNKRGAEGETSHNENGVNRSYESASVPESMLRGIMPFAKVIGG